MGYVIQSLESAGFGLNCPDYEVLRVGSPSSDLISDMDLQALVDDELDSSRRYQVMAAIKEDEKAQRRFEELCRQKELLRLWWNAYPGKV